MKLSTDLCNIISVLKKGIANNFVNFKPRKNSVIVHIKLEKLEEYDELIEDYDIDQIEYERWKQYRFKKEKSLNMLVINRLKTH